MDSRLSRPRPEQPRGRRRLAFLGLVALVALGHLTLTSELGDRLGDMNAAQAMPPRIAVAYVRTIEPEAPRAVVAVAAAPAPRAPRRVSRPVAGAASAASQAASAPEPTAVASTEPEVFDASPSASAPIPVDAPSAAATAAAVAASAALAIADAALPASAPASSAEGFTWPSATRVSYVLTGNYRGEVNGSAEVEWIRVGERYQVNVDLVVGPSFAPIITRRASSNGLVTGRGLAPERYDEDTKVVLRDRRRVSVVFEPGAVVLANGQRRDTIEGVQDSASQFIQFTWLFSTRPELLRLGNSFQLPLALPRSMKSWTYEVADEGRLDTPLGPLNAFHLKPRAGGRREGALLVEMWFAPELRFLPVKIRIEQDEATFLDLLIAKKPEIAG